MKNWLKNLFSSNDDDNEPIVIEDLDGPIQPEEKIQVTSIDRDIVRNVSVLSKENKSNTVKGVEQINTDSSLPKSTNEPAKIEEIKIEVAAPPPPPAPPPPVVVRPQTKRVVKRNYGDGFTSTSNLY